MPPGYSYELWSRYSGQVNEGRSCRQLSESWKWRIQIHTLNELIVTLIQQSLELPSPCRRPEPYQCSCQLDHLVRCEPAVQLQKSFADIQPTLDYSGQSVQFTNIKLVSVLIAKMCSPLYLPDLVSNLPLTTNTGAPPTSGFLELIIWPNNPEAWEVCGHDLNMLDGLRVSSIWNHVVWKKHLWKPGKRNQKGDECCVAIDTI